MGRVLDSRSASIPIKSSPVWLRAGFWICILIAVAVVIRRMFALAHPALSGPPQMVSVDAFFASHAGLTLAHIVPALLFVLLIPMFFTQRFGQAEWLEQVLYPLGAVVGLTAYAMSVDSVGGWVERAAVLAFNSLYLFSLAQSYWYKLKGQLALQRRSMTRAVGILLGIATTRPVMGVFFATSPLTHLKPSQFFGIAFWIGFSINTAVVELWLRGRERASSEEGMALHLER